MIEDLWSISGQEKAKQAERSEAASALRLAALGDTASMESLVADPLRLRCAINQAIGRLEGEGRLIPGIAYEDHERAYRLKRFNERGLPEMDPQSLREWAVAMLSSGQEHPLKKDLAQLEMAILKGDAELALQTLERSPMAPWVMDFSLRQYEAENLLCFAAKYAPAPGDFAIIDALLGMGLSLPPRGALTRLEAPALAKAMPGFEQKGAQRVGECLERAGWVFEFADYVMLFARARDERDPMAPPEARTRPDLLIEKIELARWMASKGVSPLGRLSCESCQDWEQLVNPNQLIALRERSARLKQSGELEDFGLEEIFASEKATMRHAEQWAHLGPWLLEAGLDVEKIRRLAVENGLNATLPLVLPWAERYALEKSCPSQGAARSAEPARL